MDAPRGDAGTRRLDAVRGRGAPAAELRRHLASAPAAYLEGALDNPALDEASVTRILRNRAATPEQLERIARDPRWARLYDVKRGVARHPMTSLRVAQTLVHHLRWRDLAEIAADLQVHPATRRLSEELLKLRLADLALGERIALARIASRGLIAALRRSTEEPVLLALLGNTRMVELDAVTIASGGAPRAVLRRLAEHPMWCGRRAVRLALVANPRTPVPVALDVLRRLPRQELRRLARDPRIPKIVRMGADRRLEGRETSRKQEAGPGP